MTQRERIHTGTRVLYTGEDSDWGSQGSAPLPEPWVTTHVEGKPVGFMVDTGAQLSVLNQKLGPMSKKTSIVQGAMGTKRYYWTTERKVDLGTHQVSHSFLVIPECPGPLLGRDLLTQIRFGQWHSLGICLIIAVMRNWKILLKITC